MGSLFSLPKVPTFTQPSISTPTVTPSTASLPIASVSAGPALSVVQMQNVENNTDTETKIEPATAEIERKNLLTRNSRGRRSTIRTSLRGLLESNNKTASRKSLLGE